MELRERLSIGRSVADALLDLALPRGCAVCDGSRGPLCPACARDLRTALFDRPRRCAPDPVPPHLPPVTSRGPYAGALRVLVSAYKDDGRRDLRPLLAGLLGPAMRAALSTPEASAEPFGEARAARSRTAVVVVPVPSSRAAVRRRGDDPVLDLVRAAARELGPATTVTSVLRPLRRLADQSALGHAGRAANLSGAYGLRRGSGPLLAGRPVLLVDDVVTSGATLAEAARVVRLGGGHVVGAATVAVTQRRHPARLGPGGTRADGAG